MDDAPMTGRSETVELRAQAATTTPRAIAQALVVLHETGDRGQVSIAGTAVGVTDALWPREIASVCIILRMALAAALHRAGASDERIEDAISRLVRHETAGGQHRVLVAGCPLVGEEPAHLAAERARHMVDALTAEFERACCDEPPVTVRRPAAGRS